MIDLFLSKFYKVIILVSLILLLVSVAINCFQSLALGLCKAETEISVDRALQPYKDAESKQREQAEKASEVHEKIKISEAEKTEQINRQVDQVTQDSLYRNIWLNDRGLQLLNEAGNVKHSP